jgi:hypothetical protein
MALFSQLRHAACDTIGHVAVRTIFRHLDTTSFIMLPIDNNMYLAGTLLLAMQ